MVASRAVRISFSLPMAQIEEIKNDFIEANKSTLLRSTWNVTTPVTVSIVVEPYSARVWARRVLVAD
jgi:hypothetical protein